MPRLYAGADLQSVPNARNTKARGYKLAPVDSIKKNNTFEKETYYFFGNIKTIITFAAK